MNRGLSPWVSELGHLEIDEEALADRQRGCRLAGQGVGAGDAPRRDAILGQGRRCLERRPGSCRPRRSRPADSSRPSRRTARARAAPACGASRRSHRALKPSFDCRVDQSEIRVVAELADRSSELLVLRREVYGRPRASALQPTARRLSQRPATPSAIDAKPPAGSGCVRAVACSERWQPGAGDAHVQGRLWPGNVHGPRSIGRVGRTGQARRSGLFDHGLRRRPSWPAHSGTCWSPRSRRRRCGSGRRRTGRSPAAGR